MNSILCTGCGSPHSEGESLNGFCPECVDKHRRAEPGGHAEIGFTRNPSNRQLKKASRRALARETLEGMLEAVSTRHWRLVSKTDPENYSGMEMTSGRTGMKRMRKKIAQNHPGHYLTRVKKGQYKAGPGNTYQS